MINKGETYSRLTLFQGYFEKNARNDPSFYPEAIAARVIIELLESLEELNTEHVSQIAGVLNEVEKAPHYDGTGWMDFKMHLSGFFSQNGFADEWARSLDKKY
jgi:hypothetical protein